MKREKGFTLIEIMIVVAIIAILAGVALPSYLNSVQKTRRTDAKEALTRLAAFQERYFFTNTKYAGPDELNAAGVLKTESGYYTVAIVDYSTTKFTFTATRKDPGPQAKDTTCNIMSIDHVGRKTAKNANNVPTTDECW